MHTIEKGDLSVAMIIACFLKKRITVLKPISELLRYDLVIETDKGFDRIQCKTGKLNGEVIVFATSSSTHHHKRNKPSQQSYKGQIESFAVYCPQTDLCYLVPVDEVATSRGYLRISPTKNNQKIGVLYAKDFIL